MTEKIFGKMLILGISGILLTAVLTAFIFFSVFDSQIKSDIERNTEFIAAALNNGVNIRFFDTENLQLNLASDDGEIYYSSTDSGLEEADSPAVNVIHEALENGTAQAVRKSGSISSDTYYCAVLLDSGEVLCVSSTTGGANTFFSKSIVLTIIIFVFIVLFALVLAYKLSKSIVKPIEDMGSDLEHVEDNCYYDELKPFAEKISNQQKAQKRLDKIKKQFTANVSHELKTPLTTISGYGELLANGMIQADDVKKIGGSIFNESQRLINLTQDIIQLSQLDETALEPILDSENLFEAAASCIDTLKLHADKKSISIHLEGSDVFVKSSRSLMEDLIYNLIDNAIKYNKDEGEVFITVREEENTGVLIVRDTGIGIPEKYRDRVFERFFRVDKSRSKETGGTGLGLAIVKHIVDYLGGSIRLSSKVGEGTEITVILPKQ